MMPEVGQKAPDFSLPVSEDKTVSLSDFAGQNVVLYFYPKDMTPGCTTEAQDFRDAKEQFAAANTVVIGVSRDSLARHVKFTEKYDLNFLLGSDESGDVCEAYGVWQEKKLYGKTFMGIVRATFLIDGKGLVQAVWPKVRVKGHVSAVLEAVSALPS